MPDFKAMYFQLAGAVADAIQDLEKANCGNAKETLISALQCTEEQYISTDEQ